MPINKETIISVFNEKLTLEQWLKTINKALDEAVLTGVEIAKKGNATLSFKFTFEDGTYLETNDLVLQQGESVVNAFIQNGHLYLTLSNGTNLDAGNVKPVSNFSINSNQHLIVNYADGTNQDLGAIFNGNINVSGNLTATGTIDGNLVTGDEIVEKMSGYTFVMDTDETLVTRDFKYVSACKNGNKLTFALFFDVTTLADVSQANAINIGTFYVPNDIGEKLVPTTIGTSTALASQKIALVGPNINQANDGLLVVRKPSTASALFSFYPIGVISQGQTRNVRCEVTFLLSDNLAQ